jgi:molecular chaperone DnaK (HSP70)
VLGLYLKELISNCKNLNPKAEIAGIVAAVPDFCASEVTDELYLAFKIAGYEKELIDFVPERLCVFSKYFMEQKPKNERAALIDFGARSLRGGLYDISGDTYSVTIKNLSFANDESISVSLIDKAAEELFGRIYADSRGGKVSGANTKEQISAFTYQHKDLLFQKNILSKPLKLYFNFANPPFMQSLTKDIVDNIQSPFIQRFAVFFDKLFEKNLYSLNEKIDPESINTVICTGGGFEMLWARDIVADFFPNAEIIQKNTKATTALGASIAAAGKLGVINIPEFNFFDRLKLKYDFGIIALTDGKNRFVPLVERNSFWWQDTFNRRILINEECGESFTLEFFKRDENGQIIKIRGFTLDDLPRRPKSAGFFDITLTFENYDNIILSVIDGGFGELFKKTDYRREFRFSAS